jgi:hypothetical protein
LSPEAGVLIWSILAALAAIALVGLAAFTLKRFGKDDDEPDGATASHAGAMLSALFLLVFAIAIIVPWTAADDARKNTYAEAQSLVEAYWAAKDLPAPDTQTVRTAVTDYLNFVVKTEWPYMGSHRKLSAVGWTKLDTLRTKLDSLSLTSDDDKDARDAVLGDLRDTYAARRQRGFDADSTLPAGVLAFTVITGLVMIVFPFIAGARPRGMTLVPLVVMAAMLGVSVYLVFDINHVFSGALAVGPDAFSAALQEFARVG